jgi:hypothetical protein
VRSLTRLARRPDATAWTVIALSFVAIAGVGAWNAAKFPVALSYNGVATANYMQYILRYHRIPPPQVTVESRQPPVCYVVVGLAAHAGREVFGWREADQVGLAETSYRAQLLNLAFVLLTAGLLLLLRANGGAAVTLRVGRRTRLLRVSAGRREDGGDDPPGADEHVPLDARRLAHHYRSTPGIAAASSAYR